MATDHISIGMVGAGRASELHLNALKRFSEFPVHLRHIVAPRAGQVNAMKERFGFEKASSDFQDLLRDPEIDVIDICTPPYVHEEMIEAALAAGNTRQRVEDQQASQLNVDSLPLPAAAGSIT